MAYNERIAADGGGGTFQRHRVDKVDARTHEGRPGGLGGCAGSLSA